MPRKKNINDEEFLPTLKKTRSRYDSSLYRKLHPSNTSILEKLKSITIIQICMYLTYSFYFETRKSEIVFSYNLLMNFNRSLVYNVGCHSKFWPKPTSTILLTLPYFTLHTKSFDNNTPQS